MHERTKRSLLKRERITEKLWGGVPIESWVVRRLRPDAYISKFHV
jgi:hypothetical protein